MSFLNRLLNQNAKTENMSADEPGISKVNEKNRYRATVLPGQNIKYPSFIALEYPNSYTQQRDRSDPRFQFNYDETVN
jgi:hypothetical protein